jgi:hypothetical protein
LCLIVHAQQACAQEASTECCPRQSLVRGTAAPWLLLTCDHMDDLFLNLLELAVNEGVFPHQSVIFIPFYLRFQLQNE